MNSKKFLPFAILLVLVFGILAFFVLKGRGAKTEVVEEEAPELPVHMRPVTKLVPTEDGHYLTLIIENINVPGASLLEYELLYDTSDGIQQGIPGRVTLTGVQSVERELLLGSESSGKFRYDQGVDDGTLTIKFRDIDGKFVGKVKTTFKLYSGVNILTSADGKFSYTLEDESEDFFIVMETFGVPGSISDSVVSGPYGVFASTETPHPGTVSLGSNYLMLNGNEWAKLSSETSDDVGIFVGVNAE